MQRTRYALFARVSVLVLSVAAAVGMTLTGSPAATADTLDGISYAHASAAHPYRETRLSPRNLVASVWSRSMATQVPVLVQAPANRNPGAPVMYLLNGSSGGERGDDWTHATDANAFYGSKNVWTVTPIGGAATYYADWQRVDPAANFRFGVKTTRPLRWETFVTSELPSAFERAHGGPGPGRSRGIAGISMSGTSVVRIAENHPGMYRAVGAYSGCAETASVQGQLIVRIVTGLPDGADASNMYGPPGDPEWAAQDPVINAHKLARRTPALWISAASGLPGGHDNLADRRIAGNGGRLAQQVIAGGVDEAAARYCTDALVRRLSQLHIPATVRFPATGTHSWGYWQDQMHESWPMFARALGA
ncbi:alpha/beta hydrolase [Gordonia sp. SL306]|uniref:alpha/beta hydrolase n=1 Tax=Gordonia sp. SL306 TaxID=2995145 RepID=UPI00226FB8C2|nr:alpha/beta hydrolase family protein [Gordonia sp. SL306]WAC53949.1 alpha/beta hydrolase family protein [Gordonia sp. SL306]